ncbi:hypothetical protein SK571_40580 [Lentzea sp. BCCO 10_0798]|uniref:Uncharacterized protein n=1 Tax=Lentzea kristufekii TaxID=3095430 RepID=A0ABU4U5P6_9PSEU|nr:hypothetical protein [Lentzea sp. BCCO 10_0798]MDX8055710.1 hypothetical protein [Lentzea sp. BCCO 10_0798]
MVDGSCTDLLSGEKVSGVTELARCGVRVLR